MNSSWRSVHVGNSLPSYCQGPNNNTLHQPSFGPLLKDPELLSWLIPTILLHIFGIVLNLTLTLAVLFDKTSKFGPKLLVANFAFCTFLMAATIQPATTLYKFDCQSLHPTAKSPCSPFMVYSYVIMAAAGWSEVSLAINRTIAICFSRHYAQWSTVRASLALLIFSWIISIVVAIMTFLISVDGSLYVRPFSICQFQPKGHFGTFLSHTFLLVPDGIVGGLSIIIFGTTYVRRYRSSRVINQSQNVKMLHERRTMSRRLTIAKAMFGTLICTLVCFFPLKLTSTADFSIKHPLLREQIRNLFILQFVLIPLIYFAISKAYRVAIIRMFRRLLKIASGGRVTSNATTHRSQRGPRGPPRSTVNEASIISLSCTYPPVSSQPLAATEKKLRSQ